MQLIQSEAAFAAAAGQSSPTAQQLNPAEVLTRYVAAKAAERQACAPALDSPLAVETDGSAVLASAGQQMGAAAHAGHSCGVVVVSLRWQNQSMDFPLRSRLVAVPGSYLQRLAQRRWARLRMEVEFLRLRRRRLLHAWWGAYEALLKQHRVRVTPHKSLVQAKRRQVKAGASPANSWHITASPAPATQSPAPSDHPPANA